MKFRPGPRDLLRQASETMAHPARWTFTVELSGLLDLRLTGVSTAVGIRGISGHDTTLPDTHAALSIPSMGVSLDTVLSKDEC